MTRKSFLFGSRGYEEGLSFLRVKNANLFVNFKDENQNVNISRRLNQSRVVFWNC